MASDLEIHKLISAGWDAKRIAEHLGMDEREVQGKLDHWGVGMGVTDTFRPVLQKWRASGLIERYSVRKEGGEYRFILKRSGESTELTEQQMTGFVQGVEMAQAHSEATHHCASCDMHSCGDLERPPLTLESLVWPIAELNPQTGKPWTDEEKRILKAHRTRQYLDRDGHPITRERWEELSGDREYIRVGMHELKTPTILIKVSTIWNGTNTGQEEIFETLVDQQGREPELRRYRTLAAAQEGHNVALGEAMMKLTEGPRLVREIPAEET